MKFRLLFIISLFFLTSFCLNVQGQNDTILYSFFTAGHTYGNPNNPQYGLHPPFLEHFDYINEYPKMEFAFFTGDVVWQPEEMYWDSAVADMNNLSIPYYISAGNHDIGYEFVQRFGDYYYSFIYQNDLFIVLVPSLDYWNITGDQKDFLVETLDSNAQNVNNIFVFLHELVWWSPDNQFQNIILNYIPAYPGSTNFWEEIEPLFHTLDNNVVFYAGDLGASISVTPYMYHKYDNITFIASGMGGGEQDNFIVTDVYSDTLIYDLYAINGDDPNALGELIDFYVSVDDNIRHQKMDYSVFPCPANDYVIIENNFSECFDIIIYDINGKIKLVSEMNKKIKRVNIENFRSGIYLLKAIGRDGVFTYKIIKN